MPPVEAMSSLSEGREQGPDASQGQGGQASSDAAALADSVELPVEKEIVIQEELEALGPRMVCHRDQTATLSETPLTQAPLCRPSRPVLTRKATIGTRWLPMSQAA